MIRPFTFSARICRNSALLQLSASIKKQPAALILRSPARLQSTESTGNAVDPRISAIVTEISKLTLLETSTLISELKTKLNIPDVAVPVVSAAAAPAAEPVEEAAPVEEKTIFAVKLESFDAKAKPKIIKEVKNMLGVSLVEAKKIVEGAPKVLKEGVPKEDADKIKQTIEGLGGKITLA